MLQAQQAQEVEQGPFYAVPVGRIPGVYTDSVAANAQTNHHPGGLLKSFKTRKEAEAFCQAKVSVTTHVWLGRDVDL